MSLTTEEQKRWDMYQKLLKKTPDQIKARDEFEEKKNKAIHLECKKILAPNWDKAKKYTPLFSEKNKYGLQKLILQSEITKEQEEKEEDYFNSYM